MLDKIQKAREAGYSDDEIAAHLSKSNPKISKAVSSGYSLDDIGTFLDAKNQPELKSSAEEEKKEPLPLDVPEEAENAAREIRNAMVLAPESQRNAAVERSMPSLAEMPKVFDLAVDVKRNEEQAEQLQEIRGVETTDPQADPNEPDDPSWGKIGAGLVAEIATVEATKLAFTAAGVKIGGGVGLAAGAPTGPGVAVTTPTGAAIGGGIGYVTGAVVGGYNGSILAQKIEGRETINPGRVVVDIGLALVPGAKLTKGPKVISNVSKAMAKHRVKTSAAIGSVAGPLYTMSDTYHNQGRMPTWQEITVGGVTAAGLGAGLGLSSKFVERQFRRLGGKTSGEIDRLIKQGDEGAIALVDAITGVSNRPEVKQYGTVRGYLKEISDYAKANVAPSLRLGPRASQSIRDAGAVASAGKETGGFLGQRVNDRIAKSDNPQEVMDLAMDYLVGKTKKLPSELSDLSDDLSFSRKSIREYQLQLVDNHNKGQRSLPEATYNEIVRSLEDGDYLTRSYRFYNDLEYKPSQEQQNALFNRLTKLGLTPEQIESRAKQYVSNYKPSKAKIESLRRKHGIEPGKSGKNNKAYQDELRAASKPNQAQIDNFKGKLGAQRMTPEQANKYIAELNAKRAGSPQEIRDFLTGGPSTGILKHREDISPELRNFLGEYVTPGEKISETMSKLSRLAAYDSADRRIADNLMAIGELVPGDNPNVGNLIPIKLRTGPATVFDGGEAKQLYGDESLQTAINKLYTEFDSAKFSDPILNSLIGAYETLVSLGKFALVPLNLPSYMVNFYGNVKTMLGMGMNPFLGVAKGVKLAAAEMSDNILGAIPGVRKISKDMSIDDLAAYKEAKEFGLIGKNTLTADIQAGLERGSFGSAVSKVTSPVGKLYSASDTLIRSVVNENHNKFVLKVAPNADPKLARKEASELTNDMYQNYDRVSKPLKNLSRLGVINQFATFFLEFARNQYRQIETGIKMVNGSYAKELSERLGVPVDSSKVRNEGIKRLVALSSIYGGYAYALNQFNRRTVNSEEERAYRETVLPDYTTNATMLIEAGDDGVLRYAGASYIVPHLLLVEPMSAALKADTTEESAKAFASSLFDSLKGEGSFAARSIMQGITNLNFRTGDKISDEEEGSGEQRRERIEFAVKDLLTPGTYREVVRARYQPMSQTALRAAGIRINETTIEEGFPRKARKINEAFRSTSADVTSAKGRLEEKRISDQEFADIVKSKNETRRRRHEELVKHVNNLRGPLKVSEEQTIAMLKDSGFKSSDILDALDNKFTPINPNKPLTTSEIYEPMSELTNAEVGKRISEISKENPSLARRLRDHHKDQKRNEALAITPKAKLVRSLAADERAKYIWGKMQESSDPDSVLRNYMFMGVINRDTKAAIDLLQKTN